MNLSFKKRQKKFKIKRPGSKIFNSNHPALKNNNDSIARIKPVVHRHTHSVEKFETIPHLYTELEYLRFHGNESEISQLELYDWKIHSRWIKYEQSVDQATDDWGSPYVGPIIYHELMNLRNVLMTGSVTLNCQKLTIEAVCEEILKDMVNRGQLNQLHEQQLKDLIVSKYRSRRAFAGVLTGCDIVRLENFKPVCNNSQLITVRTLMQNMKSLKSMPIMEPVIEEESLGLDSIVEEESSGLDSVVVEVNEKNYDNSLKEFKEKNGVQMFFIGNDDEQNVDENHTTINEKPAFFPSNHESLSKSSKPTSSVFNLNREIQNNFHTKLANLKHRFSGQDRAENIMVETFLIMVGEVEFLEKPVIAFVRLNGKNFKYDLDGFSVKIRYLFICLGPKGRFSYLEIGRCMGNLMNDQTFKTAVYRARNFHDFIKAFHVHVSHSLCLLLPKGDFSTELLSNMTEWIKKKMNKKPLAKSHNYEVDSNRISKPRKRSLINSKESQKCAKKITTSLNNNSSLKTNAIQSKNKPDPFKPTGCLFGNLVQETKHRYKQYLSDIKDGLNWKCLVSAIFIFSLCLAPSLTFGGVLATKTHYMFGINEMLIATASNGIFFSLFSGQPLMLFGSTGPMIVFEEMLFIFCHNYFHIDFLATRIWVAVWILFFSLLIVAFELTRIIKYVTRFTEEIFATLIALNFLLDVGKQCYRYLKKNPIYTAEKYCSLMYDYLSIQNRTFTNQNDTHVYRFNESLDNRSYDYNSIINYKNLYEHDNSKINYAQPNNALLSLILIFVSFGLASCLKLLRRSNFLSSSIRKFISDIGILFTILVIMLFDYMIHSLTSIQIQKVDVPNKFMPTKSTRISWFVSPFGNNFTHEQSFTWWIPLVAIFPAILILVIVFFEIELIGILLTAKRRNLKKGTGFSLDLVLGSIMMLSNSFFGLPWMCAAPERSVAHWASLATYSHSNIPGEKIRLISVKEQRITALLVHIGIGLCLAFKPFLRLIPVPALFGILLYFGITNIAGTQLWDRIIYLITPFKHLPNYGYARGVRVVKRNIFTLIQLVSVVGLLVFKSIAVIWIFFPLFLIGLVFFRVFVLPKIYSERELEQLDDEEEQVKDIENINYEVGFLGW